MQLVLIDMGFVNLKQKDYALAYSRLTYKIFEIGKDVT